jgi:[NiFe] hydrogenase diaphorase moiety small subunit
MKQFFLDGAPVPFEDGDTLMDAATRAGHHAPPVLAPATGAKRRLPPVHGQVDGRMAAACTTRASEGLEVHNHTPELTALRRQLTQMLFVEGNHYCPGCEKSGNCELQSTAYALGMADMRHDLLMPQRPVDASHPDLWLDHNRCILCKLCLRASRELDGKDVFAIGGYGAHTQLLVNAPDGRLGASALQADDHAAHICPVGALLPKRRGFAIPIGQRHCDTTPPPPLPQDADHGPT